MDFKKGDLVMAVNGREKGEYFVIKDITESGTYIGVPAVKK